MQQKPKFVRSTNLNDKLQEQARAYDKLIRTLFKIQSSNLPRNQKIELLKNEFNTISQKDVEKNSIFIERLEHLCKEMKQSKAGLNRFLLDALKLFCSAELLDLTTLQDLTGDPSISIDKEPDLVPVKVKTAEEQIQHFLDELIKRKVGEHLRREKDAEVKKLLTELQNINFAELDSNIDKFEFEQYGSSQNGFSLQDSDYDISIATKDPVDERKMLNFFYEKAKDLLKNLIGRDGFQITRITHENIRIPLVRVRLVKENLDLSFAVNSQLEIWNTHLIKAYSEFDKRCYKLGLLVKIWARTHKVVSSQKNYLSSYGFMLLVIHFLQNLKNPILPNLQELSKAEKRIQVCRKINQGKLETFDARIDYEKDPKILEEITLQYSNKMTDIELLREFFKYYQEKENFRNKKISIREGSLLPRSLEGEEKNYLYSIEDPFDSRHNPGRTLQQGSPQAEELINTLKKSYELLEQDKFKEVFQPYL